jgi:plasmid stabilization system protein ParE
MKSFKTADTYAADLQRAYDYFKQGGENAAERFFVRYQRARKTIQANPRVCRLRPNGWRQLTIPGSTYAIFYREAPQFWFLGGLISIVQDPDVIQARLLLLELGKAGD